MSLPACLDTIVVRGKQRSLLRAIDRSSVRLWGSPGLSLHHPVVIISAEHDRPGTVASAAWLIGKRGTMGIDGRALVNGGHHDGRRRDDIREVHSKSGVRETFSFDITKSYGRWSDLQPAWHAHRPADLLPWHWCEGRSTRRLLPGIDGCLGRHQTRPSPAGTLQP